MAVLGGAHQALGGDQCPIRAYNGRDALSTSRRIGLEGLLESARERVCRRCGCCVRDSETRLALILCRGSSAAEVFACLSIPCRATGVRVHHPDALPGRFVRQQ